MPRIRSTKQFKEKYVNTIITESGHASGDEAQMSGPPRSSPDARCLENLGLEMCRGETAHSYRKALQALLGFSTTLLGAVLLDDGIVVHGIYLYG